jgi:hypothetical protein
MCTDRRSDTQHASEYSTCILCLQLLTTFHFVLY